MGPKPLQHFLPTFTLNVVLQGGKGGRHDIAVMYLRTDGLDRVRPTACEYAPRQHWTGLACERRVKIA